MSNHVTKRNRANEKKARLVLKTMAVLFFLWIAFLWISMTIGAPHDLYSASEYHDTVFTVVVNGREY